MPNNRRLPRTIRNIDPSMIPGFIGESKYASLNSKIPTLPALEQPPAPKHFPSPNIPIDDDFYFELLIFFFTSVCNGLQFIHLYRTVWWTSNSHTNQALNFYLIDTSLVIFIFVILSRRLIYIIGIKMIDFLVSPKYQYFSNFIYRIVLIVTMVIILSVCTLFAVKNNLIINTFYLYYPISMYFLLFGFKIKPFFESVNWEMDILPPLHACTSIAGDIRQEVENLKINFNNRLMQIMYSSLINAYYAGVIPCCFAQNYLHYDFFWATQHSAFIFLSCLVAYCCHILHPRYCDILHRSALHLGNWDKMETRNLLLVNNKWNEDTLWPYGVLVRYGKDVYRAQGECNSGEPGSSANSRFYTTFKNPSSILRYLLLLHVLLISWQLYLLFFSVFWHNTISLSFILFFNYYLMYKVLRDYLVSSHIYKEEKMMHEKSHR